MVTYKEAMNASLEYFKNDDLAAQVYIGKYALISPGGDILEPTPDLMHRRLAREFARIESKYPNPLSEQEIFSYLDQFKYIIPQGSPMSGIGNPYQTVSLSNCFVIDSPKDSYGGILKTDQEEVQIMKRRGGVGFDISTIRPRGQPTSNAAKTTDGIGVFMERFSNTCREVAQGGRRGALMLTISVHHPEIETFIKIKRDLKKVTGANISIRLSDEFMKAVEAKEDVELRFPVDSKSPSISVKRSAVELWDMIIASAHGVAEPGLLFWDTIQQQTPTEGYEEFRSVSTNPCLSEDTLIAVADGRIAVSIKQLAIEEKDVPLYSVNPLTGEVSIKTGRNPRVTGVDKKLIRVKLDDGSHFDVTPEHKCLLKDGTSILAKDLKKGMSLPRLHREKFKPAKNSQEYYRIKTNVKEARRYTTEHRLIAEFHNSHSWNEKYDQAKKNGWVKGGLVVHHKDYDGLNNSPDNLEIMSFRDHSLLHAKQDNRGENNSRYLNVTNSQVKEQALKFTEMLGRRFSTEEWLSFAKNNSLPQAFSEWRQTGFFKNTAELSKQCALEMGYLNVDCDPRLLKTMVSMVEQGYECKLADNKVLVQKNCETCQTPFFIQHDRREISFCSHTCSLVYVNSNNAIAKKRIEGRNLSAQKHAKKTCEQQTRIYSQLKFELGRAPRQEEWETVCKKEKISYRVGKVLKYGFSSWKELKKEGDNYNHKVLEIEELPGTHTVYNITTDENHTVGIITNTNNLCGTFVAQCGEIVLSPYDSCRLLLLNVLSFIKNPWTPSAKFDYELYAKVTRIAQRLMDDIIDLELECIDKILRKIEADPEPEDVKRVEVELWNKIRNACVRGRRTGLGVTAIGDAVAALGATYGDKESIELVETIYRELALNAYRETVNLAAERGPFPAFDYDLEKNHPFLQRVMALDPELKKNWKKHGRRNIALTTTAPAGSVSMLTQTTSGIEPAYLLSYKRRKKINPNDIDVQPDFVDELGDKWKEFTVYHHGFAKWLELNPPTENQGLAERTVLSPYWHATSNDIDWTAKILMQAGAQKWVCHSISNTTNIPQNTPVDVVKEIYMTGWKTGCKGVTVYRDGSRAGVLVAESAEKPKKENNELSGRHAPKRPDELPCDIHTTTVKGEKWTFFVGLLDGKPYEIMGGLSSMINLPKRIKTGKILKHNGPANPIARYDLHYDFDRGPEDETIVRDITTVFDNATHAAFTRTLSLALRHGAPVQYIVEQIVKGSEKDDDLFSFSRAISRVLKAYIEDGTKASGSKKCPQCGSEHLVYQEGCLSCKNCGFSKCS